MRDDHFMVVWIIKNCCKYLARHNLAHKCTPRNIIIVSKHRVEECFNFVGTIRAIFGWLESKFDVLLENMLNYSLTRIRG